MVHARPQEVAVAALGIAPFIEVVARADHHRPAVDQRALDLRLEALRVDRNARRRPPRTRAPGAGRPGRSRRSRRDRPRPSDTRRGRRRRRRARPAPDPTPLRFACTCWRHRVARGRGERRRDREVVEPELDVVLAAREREPVDEDLVRAVREARVDRAPAAGRHLEALSSVIICCVMPNSYGTDTVRVERRLLDRRVRRRSGRREQPSPYPCRRSISAAATLVLPTRASSPRSRWRAARGGSSAGSARGACRRCASTSA